jgi:hypothetical protein
MEKNIYYLEYKIVNFTEEILMKNYQIKDYKMN